MFIHNAIIGTVVSTCLLTNGGLPPVDCFEAEASPTPVSVIQVADNYEEIPFVSQYEIEKITKTLYGECRSNQIPTMEKAAVVWCILNRCDAWEQTIDEVITKSQFHGYSKNHPIDDELLNITQDVVCRWQLEKIGLSENVGRVLPKEYLYFAGRNGHNWFRKDYKSCSYWDWEYDNPYATENIELY